MGSWVTHLVCCCLCIHTPDHVLLCSFEIAYAVLPPPSLLEKNLVAEPRQVSLPAGALVATLAGVLLCVCIRTELHAHYVEFVSGVCARIPLKLRLEGGGRHSAAVLETRGHRQVFAWGR